MKRPMKNDSVAMLEDMGERPRFYKFLKGVHENVCSFYGKVPYELVRNQFWASVEFLTSRERNILIGYLAFNLGGNSFYRNLGIKSSTAKTIKKRAMAKVNRIIFKQLEVEKVISSLSSADLTKT